MSNIGLGGSTTTTTEQLHQLSQITSSKIFNGDHINFRIANDGTVDFGRLLELGLRVTVHILDAGTNISGGTSYTIDYQGGIQIVFEGTGLSTSGQFVPNAGTVTEITVSDTSIPGSPAILARFSADVAAGFDMRVPFSSDLLTGGSRVYHQLMIGNNKIAGSENDDVIVSGIGDNFLDGAGGYNSLIMNRDVDSFDVVRNR